MKCLVTGGAGFIGFHVAQALLERGDEVICIDNFNDYYDPKLKEDRSKVLESYPKYCLCRGDISDYNFLKKVCTEHKIDKICHLAAQAGVLCSLKNPFVYEKSNILGTLNIFELAREFNIPQVVFASSSSVYGNNDKFPSSEEDPVDRPISLYAVTKKSNELMAHCYHHLYGIRMIGLRFFNVYGEWMRPEMMPWIFTESILTGKEIKLNSNGDTWKDYTYITDIVSGIIKALDSSLAYEIINLGNNHPVHLKHCLEIIENELGKRAMVINQPLPAGDVPKSCADISKAKKLLDWEPTIKIEDGLPSFVRWYRKYKHL